MAACEGVGDVSDGDVVELLCGGPVEHRLDARELETAPRRCKSRTVEGVYRAYAYRSESIGSYTRPAKTANNARDARETVRSI